jgi:hypothetical protein
VRRDVKSNGRAEHGATPRARHRLTKLEQRLGFS